MQPTEHQPATPKNAVSVIRSQTFEPANEKAAQLLRHLQENESQRTEINGYVNQLNIQLHRWQLRLQTLNERNSALKVEIASLINPAEFPNP